MGMTPGKKRPERRHDAAVAASARDAGPGREEEAGDRGRQGRDDEAGRRKAGAKAPDKSGKTRQAHQDKVADKTGDKTGGKKK